MNSRALLALAAIAASVSTVQSETVTYRFDSDSPSVTLNEFAGLVTANDAVTPPYVNPGNVDATTGISSERYERTLSDDEANSDGVSELILTLDIGATPVSLTNLSFLQGIDSQQGTNNTYSIVDLGITTTGAETPSASMTQFTSTADFGTEIQSISSIESVSLSGLENLSNVSVVFTFGVKYGTTPDGTGGDNLSRFAFIDDVVITGSAVPEPTAATVVVLGLVGVGLARKRTRV